MTLFLSFLLLLLLISIIDTSSGRNKRNQSYRASSSHEIRSYRPYKPRVSGPVAKFTRLQTRVDLEKYNGKKNQQVIEEGHQKYIDMHLNNHIHRFVKDLLKRNDIYDRLDHKYKYRVASILTKKVVELYKEHHTLLRSSHSVITENLDSTHFKDILASLTLSIEDILHTADIENQHEHELKTRIYTRSMTNARNIDTDARRKGQNYENIEQELGGLGLIEDISQRRIVHARKS